MLKNLILRSMLIVFFVFLFTGCAHKVSLEGNIDKRLLKSHHENPIDVSVAYYIDSQDLNKEYVTDGGGGDNISYFPYKDIDGMLRKTLSTIFSSVEKIESLENIDSGIKYIFKPDIQTKSSSSSYAFWPPEMFSIIINYQALDNNNQVVWQTQVVGNGEAVFDDFIKDHSAAPKRATIDAMYHLHKEILNSSIFFNNTAISNDENKEQTKQNKTWR